MDALREEIPGRAGAREPGERHPHAQLAGLAASGAPLRRALARLAGRFVAVRGWEALGFARLRDWARERAGLSARELQELAWVDARLAVLPEIERAFLEGRLPWTKVRLLCRAATPQDEELWLAAGEDGTCAALAREVRAVDRGCVEAGVPPPAPIDEDDERVESTVVHGSPWLAARWGDVQRLARKVAGEALPRAAVIEAVTAEVLSAIRLEVEPGTARAPALRRTGAEAGAAAPDAMPCTRPTRAGAAGTEFLVSLAEGIDELDARALDARLRRAAALERGLLARIGPLLAQVASERSYRHVGLRSLDAYAVEWLGMCPRNAKALLRLERACLVSTPLGEAWRSGALPWCKAQALAELAELEHAGPWMAAWIERSQRVTVRRLEDDLEHALATGELDPSAVPAYPAGVQIGARARGSQPSVAIRLGGPESIIRLFRATVASVQRRIERLTGRSSSRAEALAAMLEHVEEAWGGHRRVPREHRIFERDGWRCSVPGCTSYRSLHAHHLEPRSAGGGDEDENLITLCAWHHLRGVHTGLLRITGRAPEGLRFDLPFGCYGPGDVAMTA